MCILLNVKKHEKTFALNVDIFKVEKNVKKVLTFSLRSYIITLASRIERQNKASQEVKSIGDYPSGCGSAWLERLVWDQEVAGSNPVTPTYAGVVQW